MHRDRTQEDSREVEAAKYDLNYIGLTGEKTLLEQPLRLPLILADCVLYILHVVQ